MSCFPQRKKLDSNNVMNIWQKRRRKFWHRYGLLPLLSMKKLIWINQLLNFYVNIFTKIQHWHWLTFIVAQQILVWQYSMTNYNRMLINQLYGIIIVVQQILAWQYSMTNNNRMMINQSHWIAFQTWLGVPSGKRKRCFVKRHSTTLTNHMQELLPVHLIVNAFWVQMVNKELFKWK